MMPACESQRVTHFVRAIVLVREALALNLVRETGRRLERGNGPRPEDMLSYHDGGAHRQRQADEAFISA